MRSRDGQKSRSNYFFTATLAKLLSLLRPMKNSSHWLNCYFSPKFAKGEMHCLLILNRIAGRTGQLPRGPSPGILPEPTKWTSIYRDIWRMSNTPRMVRHTNCVNKASKSLLASYFRSYMVQFRLIV